MPDEPASEDRRSVIDTSVAHPARRYNYWLGGKDNFAADRESGDLIAAAWPSVRTAARENRGFLKRAIGYLAGPAGIEQFLDIGTGLPTADNTHEVAQSFAPHARVVYVDNDPMVMMHAKALMTSTPAGATTYIEGDLREPERILAHPDLTATLDLSRPIGLMLVAVLHFIPSQQDAVRIVRRLVSALAPGSFVAVTNATKDLLPPQTAAVYEAMLNSGRTDVWPRSRDEFAALFAGLELVEPGIVPVSEWRPVGDGSRPDPADVAVYGAVARVR